MASTATAQATEGGALILYQQHCAVCHGEERLGGMGPALLPENLGRLRKSEASEVIIKGRVATQMQGFGDRLKGEEIQALVDFIYTPLAELPHWDLAATRDSQIVHHRLDTLSATPLFKADMLNLFVVVELGDHHFTLLDGDTFEAVGRFPTRFALHGGPKYSPDGRFVYFASRDGWIAKFDLYNLKWVAEIRAGINTRNIAVSGDGRYLMVANYLPHTLVLLDAEYLTPIKQFEVRDSTGKSSRVSAVYTAKPRQSFVVALKDVPELWEISYADTPPPGFAGWEHSYHKEAGDLQPGEPFPRLRIPVEAHLDDFFFNQGYDLLIGASREGKGMVVSLDVKRVINTLDLPGMPHLGSGITWEYQGHKVMATPNLKEGVVSIIDMESWQTIKRIETLGPGFFMRSHDNSPYAWVDVFFGPHKDAVHVIDKKSLEIVKTLRPAPGKTAAHVEFTRDGKYALLSIWEMEGEVIVYDATTLEEVKRLPMKKPSGKYNVWNKTRYEGGTSH
ncbi:MAG: nitrite reductase [Gammaproteobacteria bacterium]|nr:nitrite reductase [Gammaproteobacteria bacterium]